MMQEYRLKLCIFFENYSLFYFELRNQNLEKQNPFYYFYIVSLKRRNFSLPKTKR